MLFIAGDRKNRIAIHQGDSGLLKIRQNLVELTEKDRGMFSMAKGGQLFLRAVLSPDAEMKYLAMPFLSEDTKEWPLGIYTWQARLYVNAQLNNDGMIIGADKTYTLFDVSPFEVLEVI